MRSVSVAGRIAAAVAVVAAVAIVAVLLFTGGGGYTVKADFINAGQLVSGDQVQVAGSPVGSVNGITLTSNGLAEITMSIDSSYAPLRQGTQATIRQASLSGIANRYVDLTLPPGDDSNRPTIPNGGTIPPSDTTTAVDLDQLFDTFDPTTRVAVQDFFKNSAAQFHNEETQQQLAYYYLNPALSTSSRLFSEVNRDTPELVRFLTDSAKLVTTLAQKNTTITDLITNLNLTLTALANQKAALADDIARLPGFMRQANTTFVDLRAALNDLTPLVNASKPVAIELQPFLDQLEPFAIDARPTVHDLAQIVYQPGPHNDLDDLIRQFPALERIALDTRFRTVDDTCTPHGASCTGGKQYPVGKVAGAFPTSAKALTASAPIIAFARPYTVDLTGWFDDFSTPGAWDAAGGFSRSDTVLDLFEPAGFLGTIPSGLPAVGNQIPLSQQLAATTALTRIGQFQRCPGAGDIALPDGSNVLTSAEQAAEKCTEADRAAGNQH